MLKSKEFPLVLVGIISLFSFIGWVLDLRMLTAVSSNYIPMAPLTTLFFIISGSVTLGYLHVERYHGGQFVFIIIILLVFLFSLEIFLSYFIKFPLDIEKAFIAKPIMLGQYPTGRMSPITASLFLLICTGILGIIQKKSQTLRFFGGTFSMVVFLVSSVLLIGYLFKTPLLYGSLIIPVALPSSICFFLFSVSLLRIYEIKYWTFNLINLNRIARQLLKTFLPLAIFIIILQGYLTTHYSLNRENPVLSISIILIIVLCITGFVVMRLSVQVGSDILNTEAELARAKMELERFFNLIPDLVVVISTDGYYKSLNPQWEKTLGYTLVELMNTPFRSFIHPDDLELTNQMFIKQLSSNELMIFENRLRHKDGSYRWFEWNSTSAQGELFYAVARDITERKIVEQELITAKEKAEESDKLKSAFLANMSHEIRTPMNGILGFAELLKEPGLSGEEQQDYIRIIEKSGVRMLNIINNIIDISKIEAGQMELVLSKINVNEVTEQLFLFFKTEAEKKGIELWLRNLSTEKETFFITDKVKFNSILTNLLKNALKYTHAGSIGFGYSLNDEPDESRTIQFFVRDTGIGIPKERQDSIFERFIQADISDVQAYQGAGLGLSISKAYVEMLGGKIWLESEPGIGSIFYFTLPLIRTKESQNIEGPFDKIISKNDFQATLRILIAEDDPVSSDLFRLFLSSVSKEIILAHTGTEAVNICRNDPDIDIVLMDIKLPEMDGYEATRKIREFNKDIVIIAQTAFALIGDREKAIEAGCNDYISKPISKDILIKLIKKYLVK